VLSSCAQPDGRRGGRQALDEERGASDSDHARVVHRDDRDPGTSIGTQDRACVRSRRRPGGARRCAPARRTSECGTLSISRRPGWCPRLPREHRSRSSNARQAHPDRGSRAGDRRPKARAVAGEVRSALDPNVPGPTPALVRAAILPRRQTSASSRGCRTKIAACEQRTERSLPDALDPPVAARGAPYATHRFGSIILGIGSQHNVTRRHLCDSLSPDQLRI
jgi:hypothetical protein